MLKLPKLVFARDYHDFDFFDHAYGQLGLKLKIEELGLDDSRGVYVALVYSGRKPAKKVVDELLTALHVEFGRD